jgi:hypothetical protein
MDNHEWCVTEGKIRDMCDDMSVQQLKNLLTNLEYDLDEKKKEAA